MTNDRVTKTTTMPIDEIRAFLHYDAESGLFYRRDNGKRALYTLIRSGYLWGRIKDKFFFAHRAAWAISHGEWPPLIDHINRDKRDNRLINLRKATSLENSHNTATFEAGRNYVTRASRTSSYFVRFRRQYIGCFKSETEALAVADSLKKGEMPLVKPPRKNMSRTKIGKCSVKRPKRLGENGP